MEMVVLWTSTVGEIPTFLIRYYFWTTLHDTPTLLRAMFLCQGVQAEQVQFGAVRAEGRRPEGLVLKLGN
jgi:hypothetical protein